MLGVVMVLILSVCDAAPSQGVRSAVVLQTPAVVAVSPNPGCPVWLQWACGGA